jgi:Uma2 family endonuclease
MSVATLTSSTETFVSPSMTTEVVVPKALIYEMVEGQPIYYRGWQAVLKGEKTIEQVMASSAIQSYLSSEILVKIHPQLKKNYIFATNEAGLRFAKGDWRAADIGVWTRESIKNAPLNDKYWDIMPTIVIEIDTKADTDELPLYYLDKTQDLLKKGIKRVLWIFTKTQQVMVAESGQKWEIQNWTETVEVIDGCTFNVQEMIDDFTV